MSMSVNHHQITIKSVRAGPSGFTKGKQQMGSFHPFKGTVKNSKIQNNVFNLEGENSQNKIRAEPHSTSIINVWDIQSPSKALGVRQ